MFSTAGLFLGLKSKISHKQNVIYFQFYIRLPNYRLLGSITFKKSPIRSIPLSILYRLFFETQGRKCGRILSWSWLDINRCFKGFNKSAGFLLRNFFYASSEVKYSLFNSFCSSIYGCELWARRKKCSLSLKEFNWCVTSRGTEENIVPSKILEQSLCVYAIE